MNRRTSIRLAPALVLALACTANPSAPAPADAPTPTPTPEPTPTPLPEVSTANPIVDPPPEPVMIPQDGFFMAEGAPQPRACKVASDCTGDTIPDVDNPCCNNPHTLEPYAFAYRDWVNDWRKDRCDSVVCPPPPNPSRPPDCAFDVDCVAGSCVDACD
jgi:hypothetical protein